MRQTSIQNDERRLQLFVGGFVAENSVHSFGKRTNAKQSHNLQIFLFNLMIHLYYDLIAGCVPVHNIERSVKACAVAAVECVPCILI